MLNQTPLIGIHVPPKPPNAEKDAQYLLTLIGRYRRIFPKPSTFHLPSTTPPVPTLNPPTTPTVAEDRSSEEGRYCGVATVTPSPIAQLEVAPLHHPHSRSHNTTPPRPVRQSSPSCPSGNKESLSSCPSGNRQSLPPRPSGHTPSSVLCESSYFHLLENKRRSPALCIPQLDLGGKVPVILTVNRIQSRSSVLTNRSRQLLSVQVIHPHKPESTTPQQITG